MRFKVDRKYINMGITAFFVIIASIAVCFVMFNFSSFSKGFRGFFKIMLVVSIFYLLLQPQHFNAILRIIIIMASPIIAHFFVLTSNRVTNILFLVSIALVVIITVFNLWMPSLTF